MEHPSKLLTANEVELIRWDAATAEQIGKLTDEQLQLIYQKQWFKLLVPKAYGGLEVSLPELIKVEEALSWADGSLGWVVTLCSGAGWFGGFINPELAAQIFHISELCLAGSGAPTGTATITDGGYMINGSWKYASGVHHATHITVSCIIKMGEDTIANPDGSPLIIPFVIDRKDVELQSGWKYIGMIATGSDAYTIENLYVDGKRSFKLEPDAAVIKGPLYQYPFLQLAEATLAANLSGLAVHFVDLCEPAFAYKATNIRRVNAANVQVMNDALQNNTDLINQARSAFFEAVEASWINPKDTGLLKQVSITSRTLARIARECVDELYPYCGLLAASPDTEINRVWRDLHTASQHALLTFAE